jgi:hypothetical protein
MSNFMSMLPRGLKCTKIFKVEINKDSIKSKNCYKRKE